MPTDPEPRHAARGDGGPSRRTLLAGAGAGAAVALLPAAAVHAAATARNGQASRAASGTRADRPFAPRWVTPAELLAWNPAKDPDLPYNRGTVPLVERRSRDTVQANPYARADQPGTMILPTWGPGWGNPSQGGDTFDFHTGPFWSYVEHVVFWASPVCAPNQWLIDAAHRNGVRVYGNVFFPTGDREWADDFLARGQDGGEPVADQLIRIAEEHGFDGWFVNQETDGIGAPNAVRLQELMAYVEDRSDLAVIWYDAMNLQGATEYENALTDVNAPFFQDGARRVSSTMFLNYWWSWDKYKADFLKTPDTVKRLGRSRWELYAGINIGSAEYLDGDYYHYDLLFPPGEKSDRTAVGLFNPDRFFKTGTTPADCARQELAFHSGDEGDPSRIPEKTPAGTVWPGLARWIPTGTPLLALPFATTFNDGHGRHWHVNGRRTGGGEWNSLGLQDVQPTWRWWVEPAREGEKPVTVEAAYDDAYSGGSSLRVRGTLVGDQRVRLFAADAETGDGTRLTVVWKPDGSSSGTAELALSFHEAPAEFARFPLAAEGARAAGGGWLSRTFPLGAHAGKRLAVVALDCRAGSPARGDGDHGKSHEEGESGNGAFGVRLGALRLDDGRVRAPGAPTAPRFERFQQVDGERAEGWLRWKAPRGGGEVRHYELFQRGADGSRTHLGATCATAWFTPSLRRGGSGREVTVEVVAVGPDGSRSAPGHTDHAWRSVRTLFTVGRIDNSGREFALSPEGYRDYLTSFPDDVDFTVGEDDPGTDFSYVHPGPAKEAFTGWAGYERRVFTLRFVLDDVPHGDLLLSLYAFDTSYWAPPTLEVALNGRTAGHVRTVWGGCEAPAEVRQPKQENGTYPHFHPKPSAYGLRLPRAHARKGANVLTLRMTEGGWLLYDAVSLGVLG